jgi:hypothetical protein
VPPPDPGTSSPSTSKPGAGSLTANQKIVYTDISRDLTILKSKTDSFKLDLNHDGIYDFEIVKYKYLALKFTKDNKAHYGWVRLTCSYHADALQRVLLYSGPIVLKGFAYNEQI